MVARKIVTLPLVVTAVAFTACSEGTGPSSDAARVAGSARRSVTLSIASVSSGPVAAPESLSAGGHTVTFSKVEVVLREIRLKRVATSSDCRDDSGSSGSGAPGPSTGSDDRDDCENFISGPLLLDVPLGGGIKRLVKVDVDTGSYRRLEFRIHKPENDQGDGAFNRVSLRAAGTFDGRPFVYITDLNAKQRADLVPPLLVSTAKATDLTLVIDIRRWFVDGLGRLVDPQSGLEGRPNENLVRDNIRRSFRFFKDEDHDGQDDR